MNRLKILIVEDTASQSGMLLKRLDDSTRFKVELRSEADGAERLARSEDFDVIFIDLDLTNPPDKQPIFEGIGLGAKLRKELPRAVIIMYSGWIVRGEEEKFQDYYRCVDAGADEVLSRPELFVFTAKELSEKIEEWVRQKRASLKAKVDAHITFDTGIRTQAAKEMFQTETLEGIVAECACEMRHFHVGALQAGYSGAAVLRVRASQNSDFADSIHLVIKVSRSNFALEDELKRRPKLGSHYDASAVVPHSQPVIHRNGLHAICIREVRERVLLRDFLYQPPSKTDQSVLSRVVKDLLVIPAQEAKPWKDFGVDSTLYQFRASACSEVVDFLSDAATWKTILDSADRQAIVVVQQLISLISEQRWGFTTPDRYAARLHGDFHCRNVFLAPNEAPLLIDFGRADVYPRLFDFAALDTDLIISLIDCGKGADHAFQNIGKWLRKVTKSFPFSEERAKDKPGTKVELLRSILLAQMLSKLKAVSPSEYGEVVMFHMLRYLRFQNIPPAKKLLAVRIIATLVKQFGLI